MQENSKRKLGRPSKGPRHPFTVKLDPERSAKLKEILGSLDVAGTDYLGSIIEAHVDAVDVHELVSQWPEGEPAAENSGASFSRLGIRGKLAQEEVLRRAQALSWKINLLLDARVDSSGQRYKFSVICAGVQKVRHPPVPNSVVAAQRGPGPSRLRRLPACNRQRIWCRLRIPSP